MAERKRKTTRRKARTTKRKRRTPTEPKWVSLRDAELLELRFRDLRLKIEDTWLTERIEQVQRELDRRGLRFRPHYWLSHEWFTPDGIPGVAIPFYLAHPRLMRLERNQMFEVEGGTHRWCMRLLRHEVGHAIDNAYALHRRKDWREMFGRYSQPYPTHYQPKPYSKSFVLHLDYWYAQAHPAEDFAETFAVWLAPGSRWRQRYQGWGAIKKLEYVDELMKEIAGKRPAVSTRETQDPVHRLQTRLRTHYKRKRARFGDVYPDFYDRDLRRLFCEHEEKPHGELASRFLHRIRPELRRHVSHWTGEYQYTIDQVLREMIVRCRELKLRVDRAERQAKLEAAIMLTIQTMNYLHSGHHRLAL